MIIDCGSCTVRGESCAECVVTFLTIPVRSGVGPAGPTGSTVGSSVHPPETGVELDEAEQGAIDVLARSGLVPPLRMRAV